MVKVAKGVDRLRKLSTPLLIIWFQGKGSNSWIDPNESQFWNPKLVCLSLSKGQLDWLTGLIVSRRRV